MPYLILTSQLTSLRRIWSTGLSHFSDSEVVSA
jgi:hypothetical protein